MGLSTNIKATIRSYPSNNFIYSAAHFARQALTIEELGPDTVSQDEKDEDQGYVMGSVIFSVTFLESIINELAEDYSEEDSQQYPKLENNSHLEIAQSWNQDLYPTSILDKYQHTLMLADEALFDNQHNPYQNVNLLIKLRNSLIHAHPLEVEALNTDPDEDLNIHKMEARLKDKFHQNELYDDSYNYFPLQCFGNGCAEWSVKSAREFINAFFEKLGISNHAQ